MFILNWGVVYFNGNIMYLLNFEKIEDGRKLVCKFSEYLLNLILLLLDKMKNFIYNVF